MFLQSRGLIDIIYPVVSVSTITWLNRYHFCWRQTFVLNTASWYWPQYILLRINPVLHFWFSVGLGCWIWFPELGLWCLTPISNISVLPWRSVLFVEETGVPGENHWSVASQWQTLLHLTMNWIRTHNFSGDKHWLQKVLALYCD